MTIVAIIPARGGSKSIPRKNLADLGGRPLIAWTIDAAQRAASVDRVIVSSDDDEILDVAAVLGAGFHRRPDDLARDDVHSIHAVLDVLPTLDPTATVTMLLPTSPFRAPEDIEGAIELFEQRHPPSVVSVTPLDKGVIHLRHLDADGALEPLVPFEELTAQRQEQRPLFLLNGSVYVAGPDLLRRQSTFHVPGALGIVMPPERSIDIDTPADLHQARSVLSQSSSEA